MVYSPHTRTLLRYPGTPRYQVPVDRSNGTCYQYRYCRYLCAQYWSTSELLVLASTTGLTGSLIFYDYVPVIGKIKPKLYFPVGLWYVSTGSF